MYSLENPYFCRMFEDRSKKAKRTEISELGEFGLIKALTKNLKSRNKNTIKGVGDDAAILNHSGFRTLVSTELFTEKVHFDLTYTPLRHLGYKTVVAAIADIYAMNGTPDSVLIGLGLSNRFSLEAIEELYQGIEMACERYGVDLNGGDISSSAIGLAISVTATGTAKENQLTYRQNASQNDIIMATGNFGAAYLGLLLLEREKQVFKANPNMQPELGPFDYLLERQLKPELPVKILEEIREMGVVPTSMIDVSDGLASDLMQICNESNCGCHLYENRISIDEQSFKLAEEFKINPVTAALNGGEDYEFLMTIKPSDYEKIKDIQGLNSIGHITAEGSSCAMVTSDDRLIELSAPGWVKQYEKDDA